MEVDTGEPSPRAAEDIDDVPLAVLQQAKTPSPTKRRAPDPVPAKDIDEVPLAVLQQAKTPSPTKRRAQDDESGEDVEDTPLSVLKKAKREARKGLSPTKRAPGSAAKGKQSGKKKPAPGKSPVGKKSADAEDRWRQQLEQLRPCLREDGMLDYSALDAEDRARAKNFVREQRRCHKVREAGEPSPLTDERIRLLTEAGFVFPQSKVAPSSQKKPAKRKQGRISDLLRAPTATLSSSDVAYAASGTKAREVKWRESLALLHPCIQEGGKMNYSALDEEVKKRVQAFANQQRKDYLAREKGEATPLTDERFRRLSEAGFNFQPHAARKARRSEDGLAKSERKEEGKAEKKEKASTPAEEVGGAGEATTAAPAAAAAGKSPAKPVLPSSGAATSAAVPGAVPCPSIGEGWTVKVVARPVRRQSDGGAVATAKKAKVHKDRYYFSPEGKKFRSMAEVQRHLAGEPPRKPAAASATTPAQNAKWRENLALLRPCIDEDGKMDYSRLDEEVKKRMQTFVNKQRRDYLAREKGEPTPLTEERFLQLSEAGFNFTPHSKARRSEDGTAKEAGRKENDPTATTAAKGASDREAKWRESLALLRPCIQEDGKMNYSALDEEVKKRVQMFVNKQRRDYLAREKGEPTPLNDERFRRLSIAGFIFKPHAVSKARREGDGAAEATPKKQKTSTPVKEAGSAGAALSAPNLPPAAKMEKGSSGKVEFTPTKVAGAKVVECVERADLTTKSTPGTVAKSTPAPSPITSSKKAAKSSFVDMASDAILLLKNRKGSSIPAISKCILVHNGHVKCVSDKVFKKRLNLALKQGVKGGRFVKVKNSFKIDTEWSKKIKAAAKAKEMAKQKAAKKLQTELDKAKRAKEQAKQNAEDTEKKKLEEERKRKEREAMDEKSKAAWKKKQEELAEIRRRKEAAEARRKFIQQQLRKRRYPVEDTRLHREDKEWGVARPDDVTDRPPLRTTLSCLVPPSLRTPALPEEGGSSASEHAFVDGTLPTEDNGRGLVGDAVHVFHFFCGDVDLADSDHPLPKFSLKTLLYALDEVRSGRVAAAKCLPPLLTHLFVTALSILTTPQSGRGEESDSDDDIYEEKSRDNDLGPTERRLREDISTLGKGLNVVSWSQVCCFYMNLLGRYYASDASLEESALSGEGRLNMNYLWNKNQIKDDEIEAETCPVKSNLYFGDSQGLLAKSYAKLKNQVEPWSLSAEELMVLLRTLTDDVLTTRPKLAEDVAGRAAKLNELSKAKRAAVAKYNKMKLGHEGPKKSSKPKKSKANEVTAEQKKDESADVAEKEKPADDEKKDEPDDVVMSKESEPPFVPTVTKQELLAAEKSRDKAVEAHDKGLDTLISRTEPVGFDRFFNAIYFFRHDPTILHVEAIDASRLPSEMKNLGTELTPFSSWHSIDTKPLFEQFLSSLDHRGEREEETWEVCDSLTVLKRRLLDDKKENTRAMARERAMEDMERRLENAKIARKAEEGRRSGRLAGLAQDEVKKLEEEKVRMIEAHTKEEQEEKLNREIGSDYSSLTGLDKVIDLFVEQRSSRSRKKIDDDIVGEAALLATAPSHKLWMEDNAKGNGTLQVLAEALLALEKRCNDLSPWSRKNITRRVWRKELNDASLAWAQECKMQLGPSVDASSQDMSNEDPSTLESPTKKQRVDESSATSLNSSVDTILLCLKDLELRVFDMSGKKKAIKEASKAAEMNEDASSDEDEVRRRMDCWKVKINALRRLETTRNKLIRDIIVAAITVARKSHLNQVAAELKIALQLIRPTGCSEARSAAIEVLEKHGGYEGSDDEDEDVDFDELAAATGDFKADNETNGDEIESMLPDEVKRIGGSVGGDDFADESDWRQAMQEIKSISRLALMIQSFLSKAGPVLAELEEGKDNLDDAIGLNAKRTSRKKKSLRKHDSSMPIWCNMKFSSKIVKAKVEGRPWWPAHVCLPLESVIAGALTENRYALISYVGGPDMFMVPEKDIVDFTKEVEEDLSEYDKGVCEELQESMSIAKTLWRMENPGRETRRSKQWKTDFIEEKKTAD